MSICKKKQEQEPNFIPDAITNFSIKKKNLPLPSLNNVTLGEVILIILHNQGKVNSQSRKS